MISTNSIRLQTLNMIFRSSSAHVGTCFSLIEILYVLYFDIMKIDPENPEWEQRDRFILSKGHGSAALYAVLAKRGYFPEEYLNEFYTNGGRLPGNVDKTAVPGLDCSTGSLGMGLSVGIGMSIALNSEHIQSNVYVVLGDGECQEGAIWEGAMFAGNYELGNLVVILDNNRLQSSDYTKDVIDLKNLGEQWKLFGWDVSEVDGHNLKLLKEELEKEHRKPKLIIANTIKGKGVSFMENNVSWHYGTPTKLEYVKAVRELRGSR